MFLLSLGKIFTVLVVGGGGVATYYLVNKNSTVNSPLGIDTKKLEEICSKPFIMR